MKINVMKETDELLPLEHHLVLEGATLASKEEAELVLCEAAAGLHDQRFIYSHIKFPHIVLQTLGLDVHLTETSYFFTKWYDYEKGWNKQTFLGIPVFGMMDGNLGLQDSSAVCGRYVKENYVPALFDSDVLKSFLNDLKCRGFVTVEYSAGHDVTIIRTGVPYGGLYNILEGAKGSLLEFFLDPFENRIIESWTTNVLMSRYPFPFKSSAEKISIHNVTPDVEAHVWFYEVERFRRSISSSKSKLARVTAWGETLIESNRRVLRTAFGLKVFQKQFRLDSARQAGEVYQGLLNAGIV